jgi:hypothetical protein
VEPGAVTGVAFVEDQRDRCSVVGAFEVSGFECAAVDDWHGFDLLSTGGQFGSEAGLGDHVPGGDEDSKGGAKPRCAALSQSL